MTMKQQKKHPARYRFFQHTADIRIRTYGRDLAQAFSHVIPALQKIWLDRHCSRSRRAELLTLTASNPDILLYRYIESFIIRLDCEYELPVRARDCAIEKTETGYSLRATIDYDLAEHYHFISGIKAITYHLMKTEIRNDGSWYTQFVLDL